MSFYIPGTQGRLFRKETDDYIRSASGKRLKYLFDINKDRLLVSDDLKELIFVNHYPNGLEDLNINKPIIELSYPEHRKVHLIEEE